MASSLHKPTEYIETILSSNIQKGTLKEINDDMAVCT